MKALRAIIVDDEPLAQKVVQRFASDVPFVDIVGQCYFATDAYELLSQLDVDLIFLDIEMPKLKGLDFLRTLAVKPKIIVTTAYEEYALEGFDLQVSDYLLKPFSFDRFLKAVNKVRGELNDYSKTENTVNSESADKIFVKVDKRQMQIDINEIQCLESYGNYVKIWIEDEMLLTPRTLRSFELELDLGQFFKVHKSFIVQRKFVDFVEGNVIHLSNKMKIPVGKNHRTMVRDWFS